MQHILPLAIESDCKIPGLELRVGGCFHLTERKPPFHKPDVLMTFATFTCQARHSNLVLQNFSAPERYFVARCNPADY